MPAADYTLMSLVDFVGYLGGLLVFSTFYLKIMARLRMVAIASNVVFIAYGYMGGLWPVLLLHMLMLPLNVCRLAELHQRLDPRSPHGARRACRSNSCRKLVRAAISTSAVAPSRDANAGT